MRPSVWVKSSVLSFTFNHTAPPPNDSQGFTRSQFLRFFKAGSCDHLNSTASLISDVLLADRDAAVGPHVRCSTALCLDQSLTLKPSFKRVLRSHYTASVNRVDFDTKFQKKSFLIKAVMNHLKATARWTPPKDGVIKLNTRGCVIHRRGIGGVGGLFRDTHGHMIRVYFRHLPLKTSSSQAEIMAVKEGLGWAKVFGFDKFVVETDNEQISNILQMGEESKVKSEKLCKVLTLNGDNNVKIFHIFRGANRCADYLAKHAAKLRSSDTGTHLFVTEIDHDDEVILEGLKRLLQYDKDGIKG